MENIEKKGQGDCYETDYPQKSPDMKNIKKEEVDKELEEIDQKAKELVKKKKERYPKFLEEELANNSDWEIFNSKDYSKKVYQNQALTSRDKLRLILKKNHEEKKYLFFYVDPDNEKHTFLVEMPKMEDIRRLFNVHKLIDKFQDKQYESDDSSKESEDVENQSIELSIDLLYNYLLDPVEEVPIFDNIEEVRKMVKSDPLTKDGFAVQFMVFFTNLAWGEIKGVKKRRIRGG